jgi:hypothetical protein
MNRLLVEQKASSIMILKTKTKEQGTNLLPAFFNTTLQFMFPQINSLPNE